MYWMCLKDSVLLPHLNFVSHFHMQFDPNRFYRHFVLAAILAENQSRFQMDEEFETTEDLYNFESVGNWRSVAKEDGAYERVFIPGSDALHILRLMLR